MSRIIMQKKLPNGRWKYIAQWKTLFRNSGYLDAIKVLESKGIEWRCVRNGIIIEQSK